MNSPAHDIALYLQSKSVGVIGATSGWALAVNSEPDQSTSVATCITVYDNGGDDADTEQLDVFQPHIIVRTRAPVQADAYQKQVDIRRWLMFGPIDTPTSHFTGIVMLTEILPIGRDQNNNFLFTANFRSRRTEKG